MEDQTLEEYLAKALNDRYEVEDLFTVVTEYRPMKDVTEVTVYARITSTAVRLDYELWFNIIDTPDRWENKAARVIKQFEHDITTMLVAPHESDPYKITLEWAPL